MPALPRTAHGVCLLPLTECTQVYLGLGATITDDPARRNPMSSGLSCADAHARSSRCHVIADFSKYIQISGAWTGSMAKTGLIPYIISPLIACSLIYAGASQQRGDIKKPSTIVAATQSPKPVAVPKID